ncbi:hypothetical protein VPH35_093714 [Triticum aestivum]
MHAWRNGVDLSAKGSSIYTSSELKLNFSHGFRSIEKEKRTNGVLVAHAKIIADRSKLVLFYSRVSPSYIYLHACCSCTVLLGSFLVPLLFKVLDFRYSWISLIPLSL